MSETFAKRASFEKALQIGSKSFKYVSLPEFVRQSGSSISKLPYSIKILLENLLRHFDEKIVTEKDLQAVAGWAPKQATESEIQFTPARVLLQDYTGVPVLADLAAMRDAMKRLGGDLNKINPLEPVDLVIDHAIQVDFFGTKDALQKNKALEYERNSERYQFLKWGQKAFTNFRAVPPGTGIVHQVNLEYLATVAMTKDVHGQKWIYPDSCVGTDSHTTMINGLGVLGWGVGGIEAESAMLGQPCTMLIPEVVGFELKGKLPAGSTATDLVLTVTQMLRKRGVVGKFVEFFGSGLKSLTLADRATIANMAPEYGATIGLFPVDAVTTDFLRLTGRTESAEIVEAYFKAQGLWFDETEAASYSDTLSLDMHTVEPSLAGPSRPQDRVPLSKARSSMRSLLKPDQAAWASDLASPGVPLLETGKRKDEAIRQVEVSFEGQSFKLSDASVVIAAITSCTNTSNPNVLMAAGLLAKKAVEKGLVKQPWVKTSLAPGSQVVTDYLKASGLLSYLEQLGFHVVGYGCTTCIGNSGPLPPPIAKGIQDGNLSVASVLSGNRNFEGRVNTLVKANYLASPPLVVAYALAGSMEVRLDQDALGHDKEGKPVFLKDIWPSAEEVKNTIEAFITATQFAKSYADVFKGDDAWRALDVPEGAQYAWNDASTYVKQPPFFDDMKLTPAPLGSIEDARVLVMVGDSVTTDHISPAGSFTASDDAGKYLVHLGVQPKDFNSYGARRGNHEVMLRGTFANVRLKNFLTPGKEGDWTRHLPTGDVLSIFDASVRYKATNTPLVVLAGKEYGTGSSRDWAAKGPKLLGVKCVIAESFERIHRSNLVGMGLLPLQFLAGESAKTLGLTGEEHFTIRGLEGLTPKATVTVEVKGQGSFKTLARIDTGNELEYFKHGGILCFVLRNLLKP